MQGLFLKLLLIKFYSFIRSQYFFPFKNKCYKKNYSSISAVLVKNLALYSFGITPVNFLKWR
ncbi:MAG: hypothetical protein JWR61_3713 [Ferruginibacter sp.]|nr:hypothetical protein [Ferruginibacter sp.]